MKLFRTIIYIGFGLLTVVLFQNCSKSDTYPNVPALGYDGYSKFKAENGKDSFITIHLTFTDGDGDIGYTDADSLPPFGYGSPYFYNLTVDFYSIENGAPTKLRSPSFNDSLYKDTVQYNQRILSLTPKGKDKSIKGKIDLLTPFFLLDPLAPMPDSVYYEITLYDRALNRSNVVKTPPVVLNL
jgi:hypothetical protein